MRSFPETEFSLVRSDGAFTRHGAHFKLLFTATVTAIVTSVRVTVRATPRPVHREQRLGTRLMFAAALSEAAPLAAEDFVEAGLVDSGAVVVDSTAAAVVVDFTVAEAVEGTAAVATAVNEIERPPSASVHCPAPTVKNLTS
jgi:hypothetical protein